MRNFHVKPKSKIQQAVANHCQQAVVHPVPGGKLIIYRYGLVFRVFVDCAEGVAEFDQTWVARHRDHLKAICLAATLVVLEHGVDVEPYAHH